MCTSKGRTWSDKIYDHHEKPGIVVIKTMICWCPVMHHHWEMFKPRSPTASGHADLRIVKVEKGVRPLLFKSCIIILSVTSYLCLSCFSDNANLSVTTILIFTQIKSVFVMFAASEVRLLEPLPDHHILDPVRAQIGIVKSNMV